MHRHWRTAGTLGIIIAILFSCGKKRETGQKKYVLVDSLAYREYKKAFQYKKQNKKDSAYYFAYKAYKNALESNDTLNLYGSLLLLAKLDFENHNYPAAENNIIKLYELNFKDKNKLAFMNNFLGVISWKKGNYREAIKYFQKIKEEFGEDFPKHLNFNVMYYNNMGLVSMDQKQYEQAAVYFDSILQLDSISQKMPLRYARALQNKAKALLETGHNEEALQLAQQALGIRKVLKNQGGITSSHKFLAEYYYRIKDYPKALSHAKKALKTAKEERNFEEVLNILDLIGKIDPKNASIYFNDYVKLQEKLLEEERKFKEQSAKIRYETQQKENEIARQELIITQNERLLTIIVLSFIATLLLSMGLFVQYRKIRLQKKHLVKTNRALTEQKELLNKKNLELEEKNEFINNLHREMRHRFSDNMGALEAAIGQLLKNPDHDERINHILKKISGKITEIRLIQELLKYQGKAEAVNMKEFTEKLVQSIQHIFEKKEIKIKTEVDPVLLDITQSKSLGAIINEFLTNSLKYAFEEGQKGEVFIKIKEQKSGLIKVELSDNGKGIPEKMDFTKLKSRGIILIGLFLKKLRGKLINPEKKYLYNTGNGVKIAFVFKKHSLK